MLKGSCPPDFDDEAMLSSSDLEKKSSFLAAPWLESPYLRPKLAALSPVDRGGTRASIPELLHGSCFQSNPLGRPLRAPP